MMVSSSLCFEEVKIQELPSLKSHEKVTMDCLLAYGWAF